MSHPHAAQKQKPAQTSCKAGGGAVEDMECASWIIRHKRTGEVFSETYSSARARAINEHSPWIEAVPTVEHLREVNTAGTLAYRYARRDTSKPLSELHRVTHRESLELARNMAGHDRPGTFRMLELAKTSRFYFAELRAIGE